MKKGFDFNSSKGSPSSVNSPISISLLNKVIKECLERNVNVYLIRTPFHSLSSVIQNESQFKILIKSKFKNRIFLDFKDFPLKNNDFADYVHLNFRGAKKVSLFFNSLLKKNLLKTGRPQKLINDEILKLKKLNTVEYQVEKLK
ncbi:MAG: hypothetical protein WCK02_16670 [Bacteroidota bacterium]